MEESAQILVAKALLRSGDHDGAKRILRLVLAQDPGSVEALFTLGFIHDVSHENDGLAECMTKAVELDPMHAHAWLFKAMSESRRGDYQLAILCYVRALMLDPAGPVGNQASVSLELLRRNMSCPLLREPPTDDAAERILSQQPRQEPVVVDEAALLPPRPLFRGDRWVHVWDDVLGPDLLSQVRESVDDLCTWGIRNPGGCNTFWLGRESAPRTAAEVAGRALLEMVLGDRADDFAGIEWWCKNQSAGLGAHFHYDTALADGGLLRPAYSSVLYLSDEGGPTVVLDQAADGASGCWPEVPQEGHVVMPRVNRWMVFPGELRHGMVPVDEGRDARYVILFNFWSSHRPGPPSCQVPDFSSYEPVSARSVASRYYLPEADLKKLYDNEKLRGCGGDAGTRRRVPVETARSWDDLECSSTFGELPFAMPMPCLARLRNSPSGAAALHVPWRRLASERLGTDLPSADGAGPFDLIARLPLWEQSCTPSRGRVGKGEVSSSGVLPWSFAKDVLPACSRSS